MGPSSLSVHQQDAGEDGDDTVVLDVPMLPSGVDGPGSHDYSGVTGNDCLPDYYDLLCLPKHPPPTAEDVSRAYARLLLSLGPDIIAPTLLSGGPEGGGAPSSATMARRAADDARKALETLLDPVKRAVYDRKLGLLVPLPEAEDDEVGVEEGEGDDDGYTGPSPDDLLIRQLGLGVQCKSELGLRMDTSRLVPLAWRGTSTGGRIFGIGKGDGVARPIDFSFSQSLTFGIPSLRPWISARVASVRTLLNGPSAMRNDMKEAGLRTTALTSDPEVTISGSFSGLLDGFFPNPVAMLLDPYQPFKSSSIDGNRVFAGTGSRLLPRVSVQLRQRLPAKIFRPLSDWDAPAVGEDSVAAVEVEMLPKPALVGRYAHPFELPQLSKPLYVEASARYELTPPSGAPRLAATASHELGSGTFFVRGDSGDWGDVTGSMANSATCRFFTEFSRVNSSRRFSFVQYPSLAPPRLELGYVVGSGAGLSEPVVETVATLNTKRRRRRKLSTQAWAPPPGNWSVLAAAMPNSLDCGLAYGLDLSDPDSVSTSSSTFWQGQGRVEAELRADAFLSRGYLAARATRTIGEAATTTLGLELAVSTSASLHVSLTFSRLGQTVRVPFLVAVLAGPRETATAFWTLAAGFSCLAVVDLFRRRRRQEALRLRQNALQLNELAAKRARARRAAADRLTQAMAGPVAARQRAELQAGGLVVLNAEYGVLDGADGSPDAADVADVTVAVAALVDDGRLHIPRGVRKSHLPGFWDPAPNVPGRKKALRVRYRCQDEEAVVDVRGRDELVIPPRPTSTCGS